MNMEQTPRAGAIGDLIGHLDETLPELRLSAVANNVFGSATFLYRCNRLLRSVDDSVQRGLGDTAGSNLRTLYETWIFGHLLLLGDEHETRQLIGMARGQADRITKALNIADCVVYPNEMPEAVGDIGIRQRAERLGSKLADIDPAMAALPEIGYTYIFKLESHLGTHTNLAAVTKYVTLTEDNDAYISLNGHNQNWEHRVRAAAHITAFFASHVLRAAGVDTTELDGIQQRLHMGQ